MWNFLKNITYSDYDVTTERKSILKELVKEVENNLKKDNDNVHSEVSDTVGQSSSENWKRERTLRITASNCKSISHYGSLISEDKLNEKKLKTITELIKKKLWMSNDIQTSAMKYGQAEEPKARKKYAEATKYQVEETGLWIHNEFPFVGASPDGLIMNDQKPIGVLEIKCLQILKESSVEDLIKRSKTEQIAKMSAQCFKIVDEKLTLKKESAYFSQVLLQMLVTGLKFCDFVLHSPKGPPSIERIYEDVAIQNTLVQNIKVFWERALIPEYFEKRLPRNLPLLIL